MFSGKKIALFIITSGITTFLIGLFLVSTESYQAQPSHPATWQIQSLLIVGIISTGTGGFMAGSFKSKNRRHRYVLDFSKSK